MTKPTQKKSAQFPHKPFTKKFWTLLSASVLSLGLIYGRWDIHFNYLVNVFLQRGFYSKIIVLSETGILTI